MKIGLISDTHSHMDDQILKNLEPCDEIWHAGDIGHMDVIHQLEAIKPLRVVHGNIDHGDLRYNYPKDLFFEMSELPIFMTHIGGYPGRYNKRVSKIFQEQKLTMFICGHSHICKVMYDKQYNFLHINPGACGHHGFHKMRTMVRFDIKDNKFSNLEVIELGIRGYITRGQ